MSHLNLNVKYSLNIAYCNIGSTITPKKSALYIFVIIIIVLVPWERVTRLCVIGD